MRVRVEKAILPGIGVRHDLATASGRRIGVITHRTGQRDLILYDPEDPDESSDLVPLADDEADALAVILDASRVLSQLAGLHDPGRWSSSSTATPTATAADPTAPSA